MCYEGFNSEVLLGPTFKVKEIVCLLNYKTIFTITNGTVNVFEVKKENM